MRVIQSLLGNSPQTGKEKARTQLRVEVLEGREVPAVLVPDPLAGTLTILGDATANNINVSFDAANNLLLVRDGDQLLRTVDSATINNIVVNAGDGNDRVIIGVGVTQNAQIAGEGGVQRFTTGGDLLVYRGTGMATLSGGDGDDRLLGGFNNDILDGGTGNDILFGDAGLNILTGGPGSDTFFGTPSVDTITDQTADDRNLLGAPAPAAFFDEFLGLTPTPALTLSTQEVDLLLQRASAATSTQDAIISIVDRSGRILGVRIEDGVQQHINTLTPGNGINPDGTLQQDFFRVFAIDGAVAKARTSAFLANNEAPLTSRTFQSTSETTVTEREVKSIPSITDPNSVIRGPGFVAPLGINNHFPRGVAYTPQVDQFAIEHTNRDSIYAVGFDNIRGANNGQNIGDDVRLNERFNINPAFIPDRIRVPGLTVDSQGRAISQAAPISYGEASGILPHATGRGLGTQPGGIPIYKRDIGRPGATGRLIQVGAFGIFFPGKTGFATEENSALDTTFDPNKPDRTIEAEFMAFAAAGGSSAAGLSVGALDGVALPNGPDGLPLFDLPAGRIDLVGITLNVFGPKGNQGPGILLAEGTRLGGGVVNGALQPLIDPGADNIIQTDPSRPAAGTGDDGGLVTLLNGTVVPEGFLVQPHASTDGTLTEFDVRRIIFNSVQEALITRAAIRLPMDSNAVMMHTVTAKDGEILGQFRMPDSTIFSIDVSTAKARNAAYYADPAALQPIDQVPGLLPGAALTARSFRFLALPRFPEGIDGAPPGHFSQLNDDPGIDRTTRIIRDAIRPSQVSIDVVGTGQQIGPALPANRFISVLGFNAFNPATNFRDMRTNGVFDPNNPAVFQNNLLNRNGIVFFPGSAPIYKDLNGDNIGELVGGFGISGDGVDQDDIVTAGGIRNGFETPSFLRSDAFSVQGVRIPYQKFNRQPNINPFGSEILGNPVERRAALVP